MKNIKFILLSIACSMLFFSCEDETDFLTVQNINSPDANSFVVDRTTAEATIFAIYSGLQFSNVCGGGAAVQFESMSVTVKAPHYNQNGGVAALNSLTFGSDGGFVLGSFRELYQLIDRANLSIESIGALEPGIIPETEKRIFISEARFLRALGYFWLTNTYNEGTVPLILTPATSLEETIANSNNMQPSSVIYDQIEEDLMYAQKYLPLNNSDRTVNIDGVDATIAPWEAAMKGRATWGAATAYLGKAYLYQNENSNAISEFEKITDGIGSTEYSLVTEFKDNSSIAGEFNNESIFEVAFSDGAAPGNNGNFNGGEGTNNNETTTRAFQFAWNVGRGWGSCHSTNFITELFKSDIVDETNPINYKDGNVANTDPDNFSGFSKRCNASIAFTGDGEKFYDQDLVVGQDALGFTRSNSRIRRFTNWELDIEPRQARSEINERLIRLADVYLMYAEALLKERGDAGLTQAVDFINRVRRRAGVIDLETLFASERTYLAGPRNANAVVNAVDLNLNLGIRALTPANVLTHLMNEERILEFAFEGRGITWQDTRRRADIGEWITLLNNIEYTENGIVNEFDQAAPKLLADPNAGYLSIPAIELLGN